jgi:hypothetical protein
MKDENLKYERQFADKGYRMRHIHAYLTTIQVQFSNNTPFPRFPFNFLTSSHQ